MDTAIAICWSRTAPTSFDASCSPVSGLRLGMDDAMDTGQPLRRWPCRRSEPTSPRPLRLPRLPRRLHGLARPQMDAKDRALAEEAWMLARTARELPPVVAPWQSRCPRTSTVTVQCTPPRPDRAGSDRSDRVSAPFRLSGFWDSRRQDSQHPVTAAWEKSGKVKEIGVPRYQYAISRCQTTNQISGTDAGGHARG